jgi:hypothetical protein
MQYREPRCRKPAILFNRKIAESKAISFYYQAACGVLPTLIQTSTFSQRLALAR